MEIKSEVLSGEGFGHGQKKDRMAKAGQRMALSSLCAGGPCWCFRHFRVAGFHLTPAVLRHLRGVLCQCSIWRDLKRSGCFVLNQANRRLTDVSLCVVLLAYWTDFRHRS